MDKHLDAEALSDYAEGLPDAHARAAADAHLAGCAQCRRELAAIQAYFRDLADLEPARAPADFLSRVRARLPRPSPWERAWAALLIPFRFIPVPIAVGVIIGVTAITVYMRQGGPETRAVIPAPAVGPVSGSAEPSADGNSPTATQPALKDNGPAEVGSVPTALPAGPARLQKSLSKSTQDSRKEAASASPQRQPAAKKGAEARQPLAPSSSAPPASVGEADANVSAAKPAPAPGRQPSAGGGQKLRDVEAQGWSDNPASVYILDNSSAPANLPLDKKMPVEEQNAVPGQAEAAASHSAAKRKEVDGYVLSLRTKADTAAVLAGLRSMGVAAEPESASSGEDRYRLIVPAAMLRELGPYLARHGQSRLEGSLPSAASGSVLSIRLRLIFPAR